MIAGDFNLHHALWNPEGYLNQEPQAQKLVETMAEANLTPLLPAGTITFPSTREGTQDTAIDLVWGNENADNILLKCHTVEHTNDHGSDHFPIEIIMDLSPKKSPPLPSPYNYSKVNWSLINIELEGFLESVTIDPDNTTPKELDKFTCSLTAALQKAVAKHTPRKRQCPHSKRWWSEDLSELRKQVNRRRNRFRRTQDSNDAEDWRQMRNRYTDEIRKAKEKTWRDFVADADERTIWMVKKYIDETPSPFYIPTINNATSNERKAAEFSEAFFLPPPPANTMDIDDEETTHPEPVPSNARITISQIG